MHLFLYYLPVIVLLDFILSLPGKPEVLLVVFKVFNKHPLQYAIRIYRYAVNMATVNIEPISRDKPSLVV